MSTTVATHVSPLRVALASFIGTTVEFYDFLIYGTAAALEPATVPGQSVGGQARQAPAGSVLPR